MTSTTNDMNVVDTHSKYSGQRSHLCIHCILSEQTIQMPFESVGFAKFKCDKTGDSIHLSFAPLIHNKYITLHVFMYSLASGRFLRSSLLLPPNKLSSWITISMWLILNIGMIDAFVMVLQVGSQAAYVYFSFRFLLFLSTRGRRCAIIISSVPFTE